jgi:C4-dicarboxylate-specific signal transduction histidine kinase
MNIAMIGRDLRAQKRSESELCYLKETLEQRVAEQTAVLASAHRKLVAEVGERERAEARLDVVQSELFHAARLSAAGQMAAALAHKLNQPLTATANSIHAVRRLVASGTPDGLEVAREVIDEAAEQALRAGQIVRRLHDFVPRSETEMRVESIASIVEEASALALTGSGTRAPSVQSRFSEDGAKVMANRIEIQQVLINLMRNAMEAMEQGDCREITLTTTSVEPDTVEIAVADTGPGIPPEVRERLFEPFVSTRPGGIGLGLSICRSLVKAHGGRIWNEERPSGGTVFRFTLRAVMADESQ